MKRKKKTDDALLKITHKLVSSTSTSETKVEITFQSAKEYEQFFADWLALIKKYKGKNSDLFIFCDECMLPSDRDEAMICKCGWKGHKKCAEFSHLECPEKSK